MKFKNGDICEAEENYILHGCNAQGVMGSGVAKVIRNRFDGCFELYAESIKYRKEKWPTANLLGACFTFYHRESGKTIFNIISQEFYGRDRKKYARYLAITEGIRRAVFSLPSNRDRSIKTDIAMPRIGCGLGGLLWQFVSIILQELEEELNLYGCNVEFVIYTPDEK